MRDLALHQLTVIESPPIELVRIAAEVGCTQICIFVRSPEVQADDGTTKPMFPTVTPESRDALIDCLAANHVTIANVEFFPIARDVIIEEYRPALQLAAELGAMRAVVHVHEVDHKRAVTALRAFCGMAAELGLSVGLEFMGMSAGCSSLHTARHLVEAANCPNFGIAIDALHLVRTGGSLEDVARLDPGTIAYLQLCDGADLHRSDEYIAEAFNRLSPGEGVFSLQDLIRALPKDIPIDVEVPSEDLRHQGVAPTERARRAVRASRRLLAEVRADDRGAPT